MLFAQWYLPILRMGAVAIFCQFFVSTTERNMDKSSASTATKLKFSKPPISLSRDVKASIAR